MSAQPAIRRVEIEIEARAAALPGDLSLPEGAKGLVLFAHGSGSSRMSSRNRYVASVLNASGIATLLFDLLTPEEDADHERRFDIPLLAERLEAAVRWSQAHSETKGLRIGLFGASTGAAAALSVAATLGSDIRAVVSRGGRPDLAWDGLPLVRCPTLLIVGSWDEQVLELNRKAIARMPEETAKELSIVPGATHLFEEQGKIEEVARLAADWFLRHLA